ncbi:MAG TPA: glutamate synthase central domain-containing protein, partial [Prosthecobacter sp.]
MKHPFYDLDIPNEGSLHSIENEKDACGVGFVAHIKGQKSKAILDMAINGVCNVQHRGAVDADRVTGDGAGVLTQIPHKIFQPFIDEMRFELDHPMDLAVGVFFMPTDQTERMKIHLLAEGLLRNRDIQVIGWRDVPVNPNELGHKARITMPVIQQLLVARPEGMDDAPFERQLYLVRREMRLKARIHKLAEFYIASFSHRTIVYKALLLPSSLQKFYTDLQSDDYETSIAVFHQRFSTNTFPTWALSHPFRTLAHNGEINTVRGNRNWLNSRASDFENPVWEGEEQLLKELITQGQSDSASLDAALDLLMQSGRDPVHAMAMLVPGAYGIDPSTSPELKAFYEYHECFSEPWDGPAALVLTNGLSVVASLDRNGLRPSRWKMTTDDIFALGSEVGIVPIDDAKVLRKGRLAPGEMLEIDILRGRVRFNDEIKADLAGRQPYGEWLKNRTSLTTLEPEVPQGDLDILTLSQKQAAFGYTKEEIDMSLTPMLAKGEEAIYSMGDDVALSVLSTRPRLLTSYFRQLFAQVTNPPIDPIRERAVMSLDVVLGWQRNWLGQTPEHAKVVHLDSPFLFENELASLKALPDYPHLVLDTTWPMSEGPEGMKHALDRLCAEAENAAKERVQILILSDRALDHTRAAIPALLATGAVHHYLNRRKTRMRLSLVVDTGEARDTHQMACLFGFGASAVCPYMAFETIREVVETDKAARKPQLDGMAFEKAAANFRKGLEKGVLKIMSKMGISVLSSYIGAQIFEAVGIGEEVMQFAFTGTASQISGIGFKEVAAEALARHSAGYGTAVPEGQTTIDLGDP